ncbi:MAG TPA: hypothetical protein VFM70_01440 [Salinimicrobium sp.]|nr:hypothetical protein [Salinimicrobium sp.]
MEKSIEQMWNNGFLKNEKLLAPKINDLYNQKSQLVIDKLKRTYTIDNKSMIPLAALVFGISAFFGYYLLGIYLMLITLVLFFLNRKKLKELENISIGNSSYEYLVEYQKMLKNMMSFYTKLLAYGLPIVGMIGYYLYFKNTPLFAKFVQQEIWFIALVIVVIAVILGLLGPAIYKVTTEAVYGRLLKKMNELIEDMKELRQE